MRPTVFRLIVLTGLLVGPNLACDSKPSREEAADLESEAGRAKAGGGFQELAAPSVPPADPASEAPKSGAGLVKHESTRGVPETVAALEAAIEAGGLAHFATIDHAANGKKAGLDLPPTTLVLFGNPKAGTPLMQQARTVAIDLPQKMLVWEEGGTVFLAYNDPAYLRERHGLEEGPVLEKIDGLLAKLAQEATGEAGSAAQEETKKSESAE